MLTKAVESLKAAKVAPKKENFYPLFVMHPYAASDWFGVDLNTAQVDIFGDPIEIISEQDIQPHFEFCDDADRLHDLKVAAKKWSEKYAALRKSEIFKSGKGSSHHKADPAYNDGTASRAGHKIKVRRKGRVPRSVPYSWNGPLDKIPLAKLGQAS